MKVQGDCVIVSQQEKKVFNAFVLFLKCIFQRPVSTGLGKELSLAVIEHENISSCHKGIQMVSWERTLKLGLIEYKVI